MIFQVMDLGTKWCRHDFHSLASILGHVLVERGRSLFFLHLFVLLGFLFISLTTRFNQIWEKTWL